MIVVSDASPLIVPYWRDITTQTSVTKGTALYDRLNICYYTFNSIRNNGTSPLNGPVRMVITNPSIPIKTIQAVGLKIDGYTDAGEPYFTIIPQGGSLAAGASLTNRRVNFDYLRIPLTYGVRIEQYR